MISIDSSNAFLYSISYIYQLINFKNTRKKSDLFIKLKSIINVIAFIYKVMLLQINQLHYSIGFKIANKFINKYAF